MIDSFEREKQLTKVVTIGAGAMAREHIRAFASLPGVSIAGIHSRTKSRAEGVLPNSPTPDSTSGV